MTAQKNDPVLEKIETLEAQIETLQTELETAKEGQVRALADLQNFQRREAGEKIKWASRAQASLIETMLPSFLELKLGSQHVEDETIKAVIEKFFAGLTKSGLNEIRPEAGTPVDPEKHEVLMAEDAENPGIVRCLESGWEYNNTVITPAKVSATTN